MVRDARWLERKFDRALWRDLEGSEGTPDRLFHFTSLGSASAPGGFEGIVSENLIRATRHVDLDDKAELKLADDFIPLVALGLAQKSRSATRRAVEWFARDYASQKVDSLLPVYVACFARSDLSARNWSNFGHKGNGVAFGFRYLKDEPKPAAPKIYEGYCTIEYDIERAKWRFRKACARLLNIHGEYLASGAADPMLFRMRGALFRLAATTSIRSKHADFREEQEWRLTGLVKPEDVEAVEVAGQREDGSLKRYIRMPLRNGPPLLASLTLGCKLPFEATRDYCVDLLRRHGWPVPNEIRIGPPCD
jgi:hypothetical protein